MSERPQHYIGMWLDGTQAEVDDYQVNYLQGEVDELTHEWGNGRDPEHLRAELADVIIVATGLLHFMGEDADEAVMDKIGINFLKYPPDTVQELMGEGMTRGEAMAYLKDLWHKNFPKEVEAHETI
jgi:hypothetical protein